MNSYALLRDSLYTSLKELDLTEKEIDLYIISLQTGPSPLSSIAEKMSISRPNIYKLIDGLERKGLTSFSDKKKYGRNFTVVSPTMVMERIERKKETLRNASSLLNASMPDLLSLYKQGDTLTKVKVFEGKNQFIDLFQSTLDETKDNMKFFGSGDDFINFISWEEEIAYIKRRVKKGIFIKVLIIPGKEVTDQYTSRPKELRETRIIEGIKPFTSTYQVFGKKVIFWQPRAPLALLVEDEYIANMLENVFDFMWSFGQEAGTRK